MTYRKFKDREDNESLDASYNQIIYIESRCRAIHPTPRRTSVWHHPDIVQQLRGDKNLPATAGGSTVKERQAIGNYR